MAAVWLARQKGHRVFERLVVVKTILPQYASQEQFQTMFLDEARVASAIEHPNVARTLDVGEKDELLYIVMEWIDGESLSRLERAVEKNREKLPAGIVLRLLADCCAGLHAAHELRDKAGALLNVVHRDVSPQNVLVSTAGIAKIIDFGVAKARDRASAGTSAGQLKGKVRYMSPEQALGRDVDRRADIWSMGAMLYEMFTGQPPYEGPNEVATLHKLTSGEPPAPVPEHVPAAVGEIIARSLAFEAADRFETAAQMQEALETAMLDLSVPTTTGQVAAFLEKHVGERSAARRRSVDAAIAQADAREGSGEAQQPSLPSTPSIPIEPPSQTSTATLGAAAVEWPPADVRAARRRRMTGIAVGVAAVAAVLLVGGVIAAARRQAAGPAASMLPPPAATELVPPHDPEITSTPLNVTSATASMPASTTAPATGPARAKGAAPPRPVAAPPPKAPPPPSPAPPATSAKKRDYGF